MEPFRTKRLFSFVGKEMDQIAIDLDVVALDGMAIAPERELLLILCDK
jgi:hypothetical protein